ncbi:MAG: hypothetical protein IK097_01875, partial [Clostridia bacterium]|nr:hypothetical protein [Clostridia bacterium]
MKKLTMIITALVMALLIAAVMPAQVFADSIPEYISEVKIGMGKDGKTAKAALEGYKILSDGKGNPVDLNQSAGGGWGSKGEKVVLLGYKTTTKRSEAVTDLALMNMKGGYSVQEYEALMESQLKSQIIPFVDNFLVAIDEYRTNCRSGNSYANQRANYIRGILNKFIDDDTGKGLGDLLLKKTKYELGLDAYNKLSPADKEKTDAYTESIKAYDKLSDAEKKEHADILTILAQSNGKATLMLENLITRAADTMSNTWVERLADLGSYENFVDVYAEELGVLPTDAQAELAKLFENDAKTVLDMYDDFRENLLKYDEYKKIVKDYDADAVENGLNALDELGENATEAEAVKAAEDYAKAQSKAGEVMLALNYMIIHDQLEDFAYGDGTLLDFFTQDTADVEADISVLYPVVASFTDGQRAGLDFVSLRELAMIAFSDNESYSDEDLDKLDEISIYDGVDRGIYEKGGVALTSDALRAKADDQAYEEDSALSGWTIASIVITGLTLLASIGTFAASTIYGRMSASIGSIITRSHMTGESITKYIMNYDDMVKNGAKGVWADEFYAARSSMCGYLSLGFAVVTVIMVAVSTYLTYRDLVNHYKVEFTPIPHYMVDEKDITAFDENGDKIVLKNQAAYYKAVECNRTAKDEMFGNLGTCADMNGDV